MTKLMTGLGWCGAMSVLTAMSLPAANVRGAEAVVTIERLDASADAKFEKIPPASKDDAATAAKFSIVDGRQDPNAAGLAVLHDGKLPQSPDEPGANFFFTQRADGGRIGIDLGAALDVIQVNTYSRHAGTRAPQVYKLYASDGTANGFDAAPKAEVDLATQGWTLLAEVDTRPKEGGSPGGSYGASVAAKTKDQPVGKFRHLLIDAKATEKDDPFGNTFFGEVDVVAKKDGQLVTVAQEDPVKSVKTTKTPDGKYEISIDTTGLDDSMRKWAEEKLRPVCETWYPKIVEMLPSEGYEAPKSFGIVFRDDMNRGIPAAAGGTRVMCNRQWFEKNRDGEGVGAVVHEMVHVVQQYGRTRGPDGRRVRPPGWLQEGIPDYIRWFLYEPEKNGAVIRDPDKAKYNGSYRVSGNFLNWATNTYDKELVKKLNAALRQGKYTDDMWKDLTGGKTLEQLDAEWKAAIAKK